MGSAVRLSNLWPQWKQRMHAWRLRLGHDRATIALLVLLTLGVGEPLLAVVHCQLWLPFAYRSYFAVQHGHQHYGHHGAAGEHPAQSSVSCAAMSNRQSAVGSRQSAIDLAADCRPLTASVYRLAEDDTGAAIIDAGLPLHPPTCAMHGASGEGVPFHVPTSPIHDMLLTLVLLLIAALGLRFFYRAPPHAPPWRTHTPLLRPPILAAETR